jgi:hypothetical protein
VKNSIWSFLRSQIHDVCDAIAKECSFAASNRFELAPSVQAKDNTSPNTEMATKIASNRGIAKKSTEELALVLPTQTATPRRKRISDISQMRLDAYVTRSTEQALKEKSVQP